MTFNKQHKQYSRQMMAYEAERVIELEFFCPIKTETTEHTGGFLMPEHMSGANKCSPKQVISASSFIKLARDLKCLICHKPIDHDNIIEIEPKKIYMEKELKRVELARNERLEQERKTVSMMVTPDNLMRRMDEILKLLTQKKKYVSMYGDDGLLNDGTIVNLKDGSVKSNIYGGIVKIGYGDVFDHNVVFKITNIKKLYPNAFLTYDNKYYVYLTINHTPIEHFNGPYNRSYRYHESSRMLVYSKSMMIYNQTNTNIAKKIGDNLWLFTYGSLSVINSSSDYSGFVLPKKFDSISASHTHLLYIEEDIVKGTATAMRTMPNELCKQKVIQVYTNNTYWSAVLLQDNSIYGWHYSDPKKIFLVPDVIQGFIVKIYDEGCDKSTNNIFVQLKDKRIYAWDYIKGTEVLVPDEIHGHDIIEMNNGKVLLEDGSIHWLNKQASNYSIAETKCYPNIFGIFE